MRTSVAFSVLLLLLGFGTWTGTQAQDRSSDEATVRSLDDQERTAVLKQDLSALERLWSEHFAVNAPSNQVTNGKRDALALVQRGLIHYSAFERTTEFLRLDGDFAIIMGAETIRPIGDAPLAGLTVERRFTNIWKKEAGTWRMIARHANVIPPR